jgi:hypothetical protein
LQLLTNARDHRAQAAEIRQPDSAYSNYKRRAGYDCLFVSMHHYLEGEAGGSFFPFGRHEFVIFFGVFATLNVCWSFTAYLL